jgi:hypothetical protein
MNEGGAVSFNKRIVAVCDILGFKDNKNLNIKNRDDKRSVYALLKAPRLPVDGGISPRWTKQWLLKR